MKNGHTKKVNVNFKKLGLDRRLDRFPAPCHLFQYARMLMVLPLTYVLLSQIMHQFLLQLIFMTSRLCLLSYLGHESVLNSHSSVIQLCSQSPLFFRYKSMYLRINSNLLRKNLNNWQDEIFQVLLAKRITTTLNSKLHQLQQQENDFCRKIHNAKWIKKFLL